MRYAVEVSWGWGGRCNEVDRFTVQDPAEVEGRVLRLVTHIVDRYAFDCGRVDFPLNPRFHGVIVTPIGESVYPGISDAAHAAMDAAIEAKRVELTEKLHAQETAFLEMRASSRRAQRGEA